MVYCGKASTGCLHCRTRRIKCDRVQPDCSQCVRVGKKCPGYRDQLSLMFRDESTKVIKKAHAQWGVDGNGASSPRASAEASPSSSTTSAGTPRSAEVPSVPSSSRRRVPPTPPSLPASKTAPPIPSPLTAQESLVRVPPSVGPSLDDAGIQFYFNRYVLGHPDEPNTPDELASISWMWSPSLRDITAALGLAAISNLRGDAELMTSARQRYGVALRQTRLLLQKADRPSFETMRGVVSLALFELVRGGYQDTASIHAHVMGGVALARSWIPRQGTPAQGSRGTRGLLQLCYSMLIPSHVAGIPLPATFQDWLSFTISRQDAADTPATDLGALVSRFLELSAFMRSHVLYDGRPTTTSTLRKLLDLDVEFADWKYGLQGFWRYRTEQAHDLPPQAVYDGTYHVYHDVWVARMWAHYRWARILLNQVILDLVDDCPKSSLPFVSVSDRAELLKTIRLLARETLVSTPSYWRHPMLAENPALMVESRGAGGSGAAGIPIVIFHIKVAACAPGVPVDQWQWALNVMQCIWSDMGMLHAKTMMEAMLAHRDRLQLSKSGRLLTQGA